jgi:hypothetical protein
MSTEPYLCDYCMGSGVHYSTGFPEVCSRCLRDGFVMTTNGAGPISEARLCETCGARAYGSRCTAPARWHEAHAFYTETVRAGRMLYHPIYQGAYKPGRGAHQRYNIEWFNFEGLSMPQYTGSTSFGVFPRAELEDLLSLFPRNRIVPHKYIPRLLAIGDLVCTGMPWWMAQVEEFVRRTGNDYARLFVQVNGFARSSVRSNPNPFHFPVAAFDHDVPHWWLLMAWARGYTTCYPEKDFVGLRGAVPVLTGVNPEPTNVVD